MRVEPDGWFGTGGKVYYTCTILRDMYMHVHVNVDARISETDSDIACMVGTYM